MACTSKFFTFLFLQLLVASFILDSARAAGLKVGFYGYSCPHAEAIVTKIVSDTIAQTPTLAGPLLRMHFHDCFVRGCDGSVLLDSPTHQAEKDAPPNKSLRGFEVIDKIKKNLEKYCPGVVSCADIVALAARDAVVATGGSSWYVETGRRDGRVSNIAEVIPNLLPPFANITVLKGGFKRKGLSVKDLVILSGGHTIGVSHCSSFKNRLYNFTGKGTSNDTDPTLDSKYVTQLRLKCKQNGTDAWVEMDPGSSRTFDQHYFFLVSKRRGLFQSDAALLNDPVTEAYVQSHTSGSPAAFFKDFGVSMVNMGRIEVLTGSAGEIRKVCSKVN